MSETPKTDAELDRILKTHKGRAVDAILINFCRQLEVDYNREHERYETVRRMSPRKFSQIYDINMAGKPFDDIIDGIIAERKAKIGV